MFENGHNTRQPQTNLFVVKSVQQANWMTYSCRKAVSVEEARNHHVQWGADENWNPSLNDADSLWAQDANGFFLGEVTDENGTTVVGTLEVARYDRDYAHVAWYHVLPEYRGKGYGKALWDYAMKYAYEDGRTIGLDGVPAQQENYKNSGFVQAFYAYRHVAHSGHIKQVSLKSPVSSGLTIKSAKDVPFEDVSNYDTKYVGAPRTAFTRNLIHRPDVQALVALDNDKIAGYAVLRKAVSGYKCGPLYAETPTIARELFVTLCSQVDGDVCIDTPVVKDRGLPEIHQVFNMRVDGENARMYVKGKSERDFASLPVDNIYSVLWELG